MSEAARAPSPLLGRIGQDEAQGSRCVYRLILGAPIAGQPAHGVGIADDGHLDPHARRWVCTA